MCDDTITDVIIMNEEKPKRFRRRKVDIEKGIDKAAKDLILKKGFSGMTVLDVIKRAKIEPITFYSRYKNLEEFYDSISREYDYWFSDTVQVKESRLYTQKGYVEIFQRLLDSLKDESIMLELLRWEVNECNGVTTRSAMNREMHTLPLTHKFEDLFDGTDVDVVAISSLLIAGVYYLNLHKRCSPFCGINMEKEEDRQKVLGAVEWIAGHMFACKDRQKTESSRDAIIDERYQ